MTSKRFPGMKKNPYAKKKSKSKPKPKKLRQNKGMTLKNKANRGKNLNNLGHVGRDAAADVLIEPPESLKPGNHSIYREFIIKICENDVNITEFCEKHGISRQTAYDWLRHEHTIRAIDQYIEAATQRDRVKIYDNIRKGAAKKPGFAALFLKRYEGWRDEGGPTAPAIQINFNFLNNSENPPDKSAIKAEHEVLPDDES